MCFLQVDATSLMLENRNFRGDDGQMVEVTPFSAAIKGIIEIFKAKVSKVHKYRKKYVYVIAFISS